MAYAHAFCLPAFDASSLNELVLDSTQPTSFTQQFQVAKDNIQELRGVLSGKAYSELLKLIKTADQNAGYICDVVTDCAEILEAESSDVFLFSVWANVWNSLISSYVSVKILPVPYVKLIISWIRSVRLAGAV